MKLFLVLAFVLVSGSVVTAQSKITTYSNPKLKYSVDYASDLFTLDEKYLSSDGARFVSPGSAAKMMVWTQPSAKDDLLEDYDALLKRLGAAVQQKQGTKESYLIKYSNKGGVSVLKTLHRKGAGENVIYMLRIEYPAAQEDKFGRAAEQIVASFKLLPSDEK